MCAFGSRVNDIALASLFFFLFKFFHIEIFQITTPFWIKVSFSILCLMIFQMIWFSLFRKQIMFSFCCCCYSTHFFGHICSVLFVSVLFIFTSIILQYFQNWLGHISHTSKYKCIRECILNIWFLNTSSNEILYIFLQNQLELTNVPFKIHVFFFVR